MSRTKVTWKKIKVFHLNHRKKTWLFLKDIWPTRHQQVWEHKFFGVRFVIKYGTHYLKSWGIRPMILESYDWDVVLVLTFSPAKRCFFGTVIISHRISIQHVIRWNDGWSMTAPDTFCKKCFFWHHSYPHLHQSLGPKDTSPSASPQKIKDWPSSTPMVSMEVENGCLQ